MRRGFGAWPTLAATLPGQSESQPTGQVDWPSRTKVSALALTQIVTAPPVSVGDALQTEWRLPETFGGSFPSPDLVAAAAGLLTPARSWTGLEGPRWRLTVGPGMVRVSSTDAARAERSHERARRHTQARQDLATQDLLVPVRAAAAESTLEAAFTAASSGLSSDWSAVDAAEADHSFYLQRAAYLERDDAPDPARITSWSRKSRSMMVRRLAELDYSPLFAGGGVPAMLTLTYPGDWEEVAGSARACKLHVDAFKMRFKRAWGVPLVGVWKREFQRRGAPHYHLLMVPPRGQVNGEGFAVWVSRVWAEVVAHPDPDQRLLHRAAGTGVDFAEGMRARDPKRLAVYFSKHGAYGSKEYQNEAPALWTEAGSVGRFWGYWGLERATKTVEVTAVEALAAARVLRRWQRSNGFRAEVKVWRQTVDTTTGEVTGGRFRRSHVRVGARMRGHRGFAVVNDGPATLSTLAGYLDGVRVAAQDAELAAWRDSPARLSRLG